ncbi:MAG: proline racemase family protein [Actinobacteria bacterium]|nr:proline racemase family protein [Actinomycetota bacterium]
MQLRNALGWSPPSDWDRITVIDSHTGGEPFRVVVGGLPELPGRTVLERRRFAEDNLDHLRRLLVWEPRGHADMYGAFLGSPVEPDSDLSVLFIHNEGFSTMCGHGIIALTKVVLETGILPSSEPETTLKIDTPAGQVTATADVSGGSVGSIRFSNVPSFVVELDAEVELPDTGLISYDLAFGGAFYAYVSAEAAGVDLSNAADLVAKGRTIKSAVANAREMTHPFEPDLGFLYGVVFIGPPVDPRNHSRNVCVFADGEIDRSPTGTGLSGRLAIHHARGELDRGESITIESIVGSTFTGRILTEIDHGPFSAVVPEVSGTAHITGKSEFWVDPTDALGQGFFLR